MCLTGSIHLDREGLGAKSLVPTLVDFIGGFFENLKTYIWPKNKRRER